MIYILYRRGRTGDTPEPVDPIGTRLRVYVLRVGVNPYRTRVA